MEELAPLEIQALAKIVDELDYYQILNIKRDVAPGELKRAYFATARTFHPDATRHLDENMRQQSKQISKRVTEAYCVLRDPRRRRVYDQMLGDAGGVRMQLAEAQAAHDKQVLDARQVGKTQEGRQFYQKASENLERGDRPAAIRNLQMALTFEPNNEAFKEVLESAKKKPAE